MARGRLWGLMGVVGICVACMMLIAGLGFWGRMMAVVARTLSPDGVITRQSEWRLAVLYCLGTAAVFGVGLVGLCSRDDTYRGKLAASFWEDRVADKSRCRLSPKAAMAIGVAAGALAVALTGFCGHMPRLNTMLYDHVWGVFDILAPVSALASGVMLVAASCAARRAPEFSRHRLRWVPILWVAVAVALFFWTGEERSWGQDMFHWRTPELFAGNTEQQTNVHNFFNPYFEFLYAPLAGFVVVEVIAARLRMRNPVGDWNDWLLPHPSLLGLSLLIAPIAVVFYWRPQQELLELLVAVVAVLYATRVFLAVRGLPGVELAKRHA